MYVRISIMMIGLMGLLFLSNCSQAVDENSIEALQAKYSELTAGPQADGSDQEKLEILRKLAQAYEKAAQAINDPTSAAENWYKAAELYETEQLDTGKALQIFDRIIQSYPDHERAADALFKKAYIYHNTLHDLDKAKEAYTEFLAKYPGHELFESADFEVNNLGVPAEELLKRIQQTDSTQASDDPS